MYFSRGNPVVYYGDEQGFTGAGGDQDARQDMFPSQDLEYDNLGDDATARTTTSAPTRRRWTTTSTRPPALPRDRGARAADAGPPARCATARSSTATRADGAGIYAFSRINRAQQREYVVALNNAEQPASAAIPTFVPDSEWEQVYGDGPQRLRSGADRRLDVTVAPLSAVVYRAKKHIPRSQAGAVRSSRRRAGRRAATGWRSRAERRRQTRSTR